MKISVLFIEYDSIEALSAALEIAAAQKVKANLEKIVCDPQKKLDTEKLDVLCKTHNAIICTDPQDPLGVLTATGEYIAFSKNGYQWTSKEKLSKQLACLQNTDNCVMAIHDVEVVKENGNPVDQNLRHRYIRFVGFEERFYAWEHLEKFARCGFGGTWMLRNFFLNEKERKLYTENKLDPRFLIPAMALANGCCENLYDDRMVTCQLDEELYHNTEFPSYDKDQVEEKLSEMRKCTAVLKKVYGLKLDEGYRRLHIANGAFNFFAASEPTEESVKNFMHAFDMAYYTKYRYDTNEYPAKNFFFFFRDKIRKYLTEKATPVCVPMVACLRGTPAPKMSYSVRHCKDKVIREALLKQFKTQNSKADSILEADRKAENPVRIFLQKVKAKIIKAYRTVRKSCKRFVLWRMRKMGYTEYMAHEWFASVSNNLQSDKKTPLKTKLWCYRRGFMPWRIEQYELTDDNYKQYLSDRDYMYLHQINNNYKKWIEDKMTFRMVLDPFKEHLPKYYFQILQRDDKQLLVKLPDLPDGYGTTLDELFRLLRQEKKLALKAASGTHGIGFYKMHYENGKYYLNNKPTTELGIRNTINSFRSFYVVTDYIKQHEQINKIYAGSVNTIRIMMLNRDGHHPQLMDAYMRIGSKKSGVTDNVAFGGVVCTIDMETGEYGNGMQIKDHKFINIDKHPDTKTPLHGHIPNWELIKKGLIDICNYMPQLEYLGFDVVCSPDGFVVLEVNSHQDLHRLRYYDQRVKDFYAYKLQRKERLYKIKRKY